MNVFYFWEPVGGLTLKHRCNPYAGLLALEMEKRGIYLELGEYAFERAWLEKHRPDFDLLHLNWLHHFYKADEVESALKRYTQFAENLSFARHLGYRIIWTIHNLFPHERPFPTLDRLANLTLSQEAHAVTAHCHYAADLIRKHYFRSENLHVIPHGHFIDVFPNEIPSQTARAQLQIPEEAFVYLFFGNARGYKGVEQLIKAFSQIEEKRALLVLMMRSAFNPQYTETMREMAAHDERIRIFTASYFANEEFQIYLNAADVVVQPFSAVLTSGSAITALSFAKPVILPKLGCMPELIDETMGLLYNPQDPEGLEKALLAIRARDLAAMSQAAFQRANDLDWSGIAARLAAIYRR